MKDKDKTKEQLINELAVLRQRIDKLAAAKSNYRNLLENIPQKVFYKDRDLVYVTVNPSYAEDFNLSPADCTGKTDYDFFPRELAEKYRHDDRHIMQSGKSVEFDERYIYRGEEKIVHILKAPVRDDSGNVIGILGIFWDITGRKRAEAALLENEQRFRLMFESTVELIHLVDRNGIIIETNPASLEITGYPEEELVGKCIADFFTAASRKNFEEQFSVLMAVGNSRQEVEFICKDGAVLILDCAGSAIRNKNGTIKSLVIIQRDITERKQMEEIIRHQATHDALTGLPNRMLFIDHLKLAINHARRFNEMLAIMFLDIDQFKSVNDSLGHDIGDKLLRSMAFRLKACVRNTDAIARIGGDEYNILLTEINCKEDAAMIANKLISKIKPPFIINEHELHIAMSIGISIYPDDGEDSETLLKNADIALYYVKGHGRDNYALYNHSMISK